MGEHFPLEDMMTPIRKIAAELLLDLETRPDKKPLDLIEGYMRLAQMLLLKEMFDGPESTRSTRKNER